MIKVTWNVYKNFRCIAEKCPDSCCSAWEVDVDEESAAFYRALEGPLGDRLRQALKIEDGPYLELENGRCPMWRQDKLCEIHAQLGHDALCQVCREYPRLHIDYGDYAEWGLELSCPEAARLIFEGLSADVQELPGGEEPEYDSEVMEILQKSRDQALAFWENTDWDVPRALAVTLLYAHQAQSAVDGGEFTPLQPENCMESAMQFAGTGQTGPLVDFFRGLEILTQSWKNRLQNPQPGKWDPALRHLAVYLIRRYWLQSVWDLDLVCRVKFILAACILVNHLGGGTVETAQLFSKEIEHDPDNREAILDAAYSHPAFTDANLLGLLLN